MSKKPKQITASPLTRDPKPRPRVLLEVVKGDGSDKLVARGKFTQLGYRSAGLLNRDGQFPTPGSPDWHAGIDRKQLVNQSLQFYRDNGLYRGLIDHAITNTVRRGFSYQARTASKQWNAKAEALLREDFFPDPDVRGLRDFGQCQAMALREGLLTGDHGTILVTEGEVKGKIQLIDSDRIAGGKKGVLQGNGVECDKHGRPIVFHVASYGEMGQLQEGDAKPIKAEDFVWMPLLDRPSQTRGVPACQASFPMLHRISDVCDSEALAWQILSRLAIAIYQENASEWAAGSSAEDKEKAQETVDRGDPATRIHEFDTALVFHALPGEKIEGIERNIPGQNFSDSIRMFLRLLGLPLGLPLELVLLDFSQSNYSSIRGSLEQAFARFEDLQGIVERYCRRIIEWKIDLLVAAEKLTDRPDKHRHEWIKPSFPWLDELKEAQAWGAKLDRGLTTHAIAVKSLNMDRDELMEAREIEIENAIERAERIEVKHPGQKVPWQHFAGLKPPSSKEAPDDASEPRSPENEPRQPREPSEPE